MSFIIWATLPSSYEVASRVESNKLSLRIQIGCHSAWSGMDSWTKIRTLVRCPLEVFWEETQSEAMAQLIEASITWNILSTRGPSVAIQTFSSNISPLPWANNKMQMDFSPSNNNKGMVVMILYRAMRKKETASKNQWWMIRSTPWKLSFQTITNAP